MFTQTEYNGTLEDNYKTLMKQTEALLADEPDQIANVSNAAALLHQFLNDVNWVGFYFFHPEDNELVLGPFQGMPACIRIPLGKGVCGTAASKRKTVRVDDVSQFPGHIACDAATNSEIVIPIVKNDVLIGVLDIDSPLHERFTEAEETLLEKFVHALNKYI